MVLVLRFHENIGACGGRSRVVRVHVRYDHVGALRHRLAGRVQRTLNPPERVVARRPQHDHAVAEHELRVRDAAFPVRHHQLRLETERLAQPVHRGWRVPVP